MSDNTYNEYYIDMPYKNENLFSNISNNLTDSVQPTDNSIIGINNSNTNSFTESISFNPFNNNNIWRPSETFWHIYNKFQFTILKEYPDTPCVYCGRLLYKNKATWIPYDSTITYPIEQNNQINVFTL